MGCAPRDIVIEQAQMVGGTNGGKSFDVTSSTTTTQVDLRLAHAVKALFFGAKNQTGTGQFRSNYSTAFPSASMLHSFTRRLSTLTDDTSPNFYFPSSTHDPIGTAKLMYENTTRMELEGNYYNLIQGYNHGISQSIW